MMIQAAQFAQGSDVWAGAVSILSLVMQFGIGVFIGTVRAELREIKRRLEQIEAVCTFPRTGRQGG